jgi:hypothetical protein
MPSPRDRRVVLDHDDVGSICLERLPDRIVLSVHVDREDLRPPRDTRGGESPSTLSAGHARCARLDSFIRRVLLTEPRESLLSGLDEHPRPAEQVGQEDAISFASAFDLNSTKMLTDTPIRARISAITPSSPCWLKQRSSKPGQRASAASTRDAR